MRFGKLFQGVHLGIVFPCSMRRSCRSERPSIAAWRKPQRDLSRCDHQDWPSGSVHRPCRLRKKGRARRREIPSSTRTKSTSLFSFVRRVWSVVGIPFGSSMASRRIFLNLGRRHVFKIDVLRCAQCKGRLEVLAAINDPEVVHIFRSSRPSIHRFCLQTRAWTTYPH